MPTPTLDVQLAAAFQAVGVDIKSLFASAASANKAIATAEVDLGSLRRSGTFNIPVVGQTIGKPVMISLARGPYTGKGQNAGEEQMYSVAFSGLVTSATNIAASFSSNCRIGGIIKLNYQIGL